MNQPTTKPTSKSTATMASTRLLTIRLEPWPHDPTTALMVQRDHLGQLDPVEIRQAVNLAAEQGYQTLRTSALLESPTQTTLELGFRIIDSLVLLTRPIDAADHHASAPHRVRRLHRVEDGRAATVDTAAFGGIWGNDRRGLGGVRRATDRHVGLATGRLGRPTGFAIVGIGAIDPATGALPGYLQRLAVDPEHQRTGLGSALVIAALRWLGRRHVTIVTVNTGTNNEPALHLYRQHGFAPSGSMMHVAEFRIDEHDTIGADRS